MGRDPTIAAPRGISGPFVPLIAAQAAHSVEEYLGKLYEVFPPARFVSGLVSSDLRRGFVIANGVLIALGLLCFLGPVRGSWRPARAIAWAWVGLEILNGTGHLGWSLLEGRYTPGLATAPLLVLLALHLARRLVVTAGPTSSRGNR
ncbi:MAG: HXXEE domain-containing protein [Myxococcaceae bacterium]|nr:MAG: HXXEE domain-containing protein [Myxococcaceae bacterium]